MPKFKVAHVRQQGQNMIIFPVDGAFGSQSARDQAEALGELEQRAHAAGLAGSAVLVWESDGQMHFLGPSAWQAFLRGLSVPWVMSNVNKEISWAD